MVKVAFVIQRYGTEIQGGSELLCRELAEHMSKYWDVEVLTTCAKDYISWKNEYEEGIYKVNDVLVRRFKVDKKRNIRLFNLYSKIIYGKKNSIRREENWMKFQGPFSTPLFRFIENNKDHYRYFFFFTYLYCTSYFGLSLVSDKGILIPTAHDEPPIHLGIFKKMFALSQGFIFNTAEEEFLVNRLFPCSNKISSVIGHGIDPPKVNGGFRAKYGIQANYILYVGRIDRMKGVKELCSYFGRFIKDTNIPIKLVLAGPQVMRIPDDPNIIYLGLLSEQDKNEAIHEAEFTVISSKYESLSIFALESWILKKPVLCHEDCKVLAGQCERGGGGVAYQDYETFRQNMKLFFSDPSYGKKLGENGYQYVTKNYRWDIIERKYLNFMEQLH